MGDWAEKSEGIGRHDPRHVLAWSETMADASANETPSIAFWLPEGLNVALGLAQKPNVELEPQHMRDDGVGLVRRQSGGGAVLLYPGVLCWEAWAGFDVMERTGKGCSGIRECYRFLCAPVVSGLTSLGIPAFHAGICDISVRLAGDEASPAKKLAGTAQLRKRNAALVHGSLLVNPDLTLLSRYLKMPSQEPDYRGGRKHGDFCTTVADAAGPRHGGEDGDLAERVAAAAASAAKGTGWRIVAPPAVLGGEAAKLYRTKYCDEGWNWEKIRAI